MKLLKPRKGRSFNSIWFHSYQMAASQIKAQLLIKRLKKEQADDIRAAVALHKERQLNWQEMHPVDYPMSTRAYKAAPRLARQKLITTPYMFEGRILSLAAAERALRFEEERIALIESGQLSLAGEVPVVDELYVEEEEIDLFEKFD